MFKRISKTGLFVFSLVLFAAYASGADLTIGTRAEPSIDPHFLYLGTNVAYSMHLYDMLVDQDDDLKKIGDLATSWKVIDDNTWEFSLRRGVKFHDGSDFTAEDVVFSIKRIPNVPNNPNSYAGRVSTIGEMEIINPYTIRFKTNKKDPLLPVNLTRATIVSKKAAEGAATADFSSGKAAIGTGPFKFVKYTPGDRLVLARHEAYWGQKPPWEQVTFSIISNDAARVAALLGGDVDMIDYVPPSEIPTIEKNPNFRVFKRPSARVIYLFANQAIDSSPFITAKDGKPLGKNPLKDLRVRRAISMAIDRDAICKRVMDGLAIPASQMVPEGIFGYSPNFKGEKHDPAAARKLLTEAGYPDGFGLTIHGPSDRYVNDSKICQAVGQMLTRIGLAVKVETMPASVYFSKITAGKGEFPFGLGGWSYTSGEATEGVTTIFHTFDRTRGFGAYNQSMYSNPEFDQVAEQAASTADEAKREKLLHSAIDILMKDMTFIPLHVEFTTMATRKGLTYSPRADEQTRAVNAKPAP